MEWELVLRAEPLVYGCGIRFRFEPAMETAMDEFAGRFPSTALMRAASDEQIDVAPVAQFGILSAIAGNENRSSWRDCDSRNSILSITAVIRVEKINRLKERFCRPGEKGIAQLLSKNSGSVARAALPMAAHCSGTALRYGHRRRELRCGSHPPATAVALSAAILESWCCEMRGATCAFQKANTRAPTWAPIRGSRRQRSVHHCAPRGLRQATLE